MIESYWKLLIVVLRTPFPILSISVSSELFSTVNASFFRFKNGSFERLTKIIIIIIRMTQIDVTNIIMNVVSLLAFSIFEICWDKFGGLVVLDEDVVEEVVVVEDVIIDKVVRVVVVDDDVDVVEEVVLVEYVIKDVVDDNVVLPVVILVEFVEFINKNVGVISTLVAKIIFFNFIT